jgi:hypothetical protein
MGRTAVRPNKSTRKGNMNLDHKKCRPVNRLGERLGARAVGENGAEKVHTTLWLT